MTNPFRKHASGLFANHGGNIDQAMTYSMSLVDTLSGADKVAATTAVMVLVNAAAAAFEAREPSPEKIMLLGLIRSEIDQWEENELEGRLNRWAQNELDIESSIDNWMSDNLDDKIKESLGDMEATVSFR